MQENILKQGRISSLFVKFSVPAIIAMVVAGMQTVIDGLFLGNLIGPNAMASVSIGGPYIQFVIGFSMLISVGSLSFMGRSLGEGKEKLAQDIFKTSFILLSLGAIFFSFLGVVFSENIGLTLGSNDILIHDVSIYIKTISVCILPMCLGFLIGFTNRLVEKPDLYFKGMIVSLIVNITLNYILIKKLQLGIAGAALATGLSYSSVFIVVLPPMLKKENIINLFIGKFKKSTIFPVIYNGSSEAMSALATVVSAYLFNNAFMKIAGESGVAAFTSINYIAQFGMLTVFGIADGITSIISYNYGAKEFGRVKSIVKLSLYVSSVVCFATFIVLFFFSDNLINMFVGSDEFVGELAKTGSKLYAFSFIFNGFSIIYSSYFTAIGYAKESIIIALNRGLIFILIGIIILPKLIGIHGIWLTVPFAELLTFIISLYLMNKYRLPSTHANIKDLEYANTKY
ncbi:MATE family efflux transporter [Romboutsia lituseburensis]|uniref:MATE family efflux transporter n=1 Tax=Romboutsia lituseburensis TaxID=1537 RepID=UPI00215B62F8|nr:MATE family efflux transporter [Romboutsia lituseburensis]MCR8746237.1 MATE family efflux transporter [Romboutsia lituseburensis]